MSDWIVISKGIWYPVLAVLFVGLCLQLLRDICNARSQSKWEKECKKEREKNDLVAYSYGLSCALRLRMHSISSDLEKGITEQEVVKKYGSDLKRLYGKLIDSHQNLHKASLLFLPDHSTINQAKCFIDKCSG